MTPDEDTRTTMRARLAGTGRNGRLRQRGRRGLPARDPLGAPRATRRRPIVIVLAVLCVGAIVAAVLLVGPETSQSAAPTRTVSAAQGVVQSTVSGSGNVQPISQLDLGFKTSGVVDRILVAEGQHVSAGELLAEVDPKSAEVTLEQSKATLEAAEATLVQEEENGGETSSGQGAGSTAGGHEQAAAPSGSSGTSGASEVTKQSAATREANLASARAAVRSARLAVEGDEQALTNTRLYAPEAGTIVALDGEVGETVAGNGTSKAQASSASGSGSTSSGAGSSGAGRAGGAGSGSTGSGSTGSSGSSSSAFAVLSNLSAMQLVVPLSESEIAHVRAGQPATVTVEALEGTKLAAHVVSVATLATTSSGVVSYDVTFQLDQSAPGLKPGMSASAEVVVAQEEGVNVPSSAISARTVTVLANGKQVRRRVVTGLAGNSSTIVLSGLQAGEAVVLPTASSTSSATNLLSRLGRRTGGSLGGGALGGGGLGGGGGGGVFPRGGG